MAFVFTVVAFLLIHEPREQLKEASPEIQAKLETGKIIDELRKKIKEASPEIKANLEEASPEIKAKGEAEVENSPRDHR